MHADRYFGLQERQLTLDEKVLQRNAEKHPLDTEEHKGLAEESVNVLEVLGALSAKLQSYHQYRYCVRVGVRNWKYDVV